MTRSSSICLCLALALALIAPGTALAGDPTVVLRPMKDNTLYEDAKGGLSNGSGDHLFAGRLINMNQRLRRAVLAFDFSVDIPPGSAIQSVTLQMNMSRSIAGETPVALHRLNADWGEALSDAPGQEGGGASALDGDATWINTFFDTQNWATAGGDFRPVASATTPVDGPGLYTWASTPELVADVQAWVDAPTINFGWIVLGDESAAPPTAKRFDSRENAVPANRPTLTVIFSDADQIFRSDFESGNTMEWTSTQP
ncbi:MAG: DNRLRE domain-containing protein [Acidobacteriota bacterium]